MTRILPMLVLLTTIGCSGEIYVRDGVTDGDTFYLADQAVTSNNPVLQSWVTYSLARSACQLEIGGDNPARANSYECEFSARQLLLDRWQSQRADDPSIRHPYLDDLLRVRDAGFLDEYVVRYFGRRSWQILAEVHIDAFRRWQRKNLPGHKPETRIVGSWNYATIGPDVTGDK